jgi:protein SCO1/2
MYKRNNIQRNFVTFIVLFYIFGANVVEAKPDPFGKIRSSDELRNLIQELDFIDHNNNSFSFKQIEGNIVLANFIFTGCSTWCPLQTQLLNELRVAIQNDWPGIPIEFVSITITPVLDQPSSLTKYATAFSIPLEGNWFFLTGKESSIEKIQNLLGMETFINEDNILDHLTSLFLFNKDGRLIKKYKGKRIDNDYFINEINALNRVNLNRKQ